MSTAMQGVTIWSANAGQDLTGKNFFIGKVDTNGTIVLAGSGAAGAGVIVEENTLGNPASLQMDGIAKVICGATVAAGVQIQSNASGEAITLAGGVVLGLALTGGLNNEIISVKWY